MNANERELTPPPENCRVCEKFEQIGTNGVMRSKCKPGHPMHVGCGWFVERTRSVINMVDAPE